MRGLDWSNTAYVRLYRQDTATWKRLKWEAQAVYVLLQRHLDRAGCLPLEGLFPYEVVAEMTGAPESICEAAMQKLLAGGFLEVSHDAIVDPEFLDREEATMSDAQRKRESRQRRRDAARTSRNVTAESGNVTKTSHGVTRSHTESQAVTPCLSLPCLSLPEEKDSAADAAASVDFGEPTDPEGPEAEPEEAPPLDERVKVLAKHNLLTSAECQRLAELIDGPAIPDVGQHPKITEEAGVRRERLSRLAMLWQKTFPLSGDADSPFELWAEWRRQSRKKGGKPGPTDWRNEVECLRSLQAPGRSPAEMLAGLRGARGNWRSFSYDYVANGNGGGRQDNRNRDERRLAEQNEAIRTAGSGAAPIDVRARLDRLAALIPAELHSHAEAVRSLDGDVGDVETALERVDGLILLDLPDLIGDERTAKLRAELDGAVLKMRSRLGADQLKGASVELWEKLLREAAGVPELSLFSPEADPQGGSEVPA